MHKKIILMVFVSVVPFLNVFFLVKKEDTIRMRVLGLAYDY